MLAVGLSFLVEEGECISPIFIQNKKYLDDIKFCVDYISLNAACIHDLFPTPFSDEVLDQVVGKGSYSLIDGFSRYH